MISHKYECIFVHIPKCGGSSVESVLWPGERTEADLWMGFTSKYGNQYQSGGLQHLFAINIAKAVGEVIYERYYKFSFIRNPWDRVVSQYSYMKERDDLREYIGMSEKCSFKKYLDLIARKEHVQWAPQYKFVTDENGELIVDFIGRLEAIEHDFSVVANRVGLERYELPHINKSVRHAMTGYYDEETIEMVRHYYARDIDLFKYEYSNWQIGE